MYHTGLQASFMYVMCGCLRGGNVDRALEHFRQASQRGIGLDLPLCEGLATALFIKGLQGDATEMEAWNVLDYIRQRGMVHRPEVGNLTSPRGLCGLAFQHPSEAACLLYLVRYLYVCKLWFSFL